MSPQSKKAKKTAAEKVEDDSQAQPNQPGEQTEEDSPPQPADPGTEDDSPPQPADAPQPDDQPEEEPSEEPSEESADDQSEESRVSDYQPKHPTLENAGLDQHAAEEERVASRTAQREEHNRRTAGVAS